MDLQSDNDDEIGYFLGYSLDSFVNSYNTKYSDKQKANWRAMVQREQKYQNDVNTLARELENRMLENRTGLDDAASPLNTNIDWLRYCIERYLSERQVDGKEASLDDFVKGYNAGLYRG